MPLLGNRQFSLVKPLKDLGPDEMVFVIDHTKEAFRSKEEYLRRLQQYNQSVWTCQCTGNSNLTHQEATQSEHEAYQSLQKEFPDCFKQPVLELVHHSTQPLEALADAAHNKLLTELAIGERVELKVRVGGLAVKAQIVEVHKGQMKIGGKGVQGKVVKVTAPTPEEASSNCSSPSSDKENATGKGTSATPKKSSLLPYKYNVRIAGEAKVISLIPAVDLHRVERIPSREFIQLFIRSYAMRSGQGPNSPWVVDEECVKSYNLPSKFSDFLVSPKRVVPNPVSPVVNLGKRKSVDSSESTSKKRKEDKGLTQPKVGLEAFLKPKVKVISSPIKKVSNGPVSPSVKSPPPSPKVVAVNGVGKTPSSPKTPKSPKTEKVKAEKKSTAKKAAAPSGKKKATIPEKKKRAPKSSTKKKAASSTDSDDDAPLSRYILIEKKNKKKATPTKKSSSSDEITIDSSDDDIPLNELKRKSLSDSSSPTKKARKSPKKQTHKKKGSAAKTSPKKTPGGKKSLKQMTLFDIKKKKGGTGTPKKGSPKKATTPRKSGTPKKQPGTPKSPWQPPMIKKLIKMKSTPAQTSDKRLKYGHLLAKICKEFPLALLKNAPLEVRAEILEKHKKIKEKERFKKMSEAEKAQFLEQKKEERKKEMEKKKEERKKQREEEKKKEREEKFKRFEDQELKLKPLPQPAPVPMPEGLPNTLFGDVAMVVEFISCYYQLLMPEDNYPVTTDAIMKALVAGGEGFAYLSRVLVILLQTLLQDDIMEDHKEVGVALRDIPVTMHSASELVRLCLKKHEEEEEEEEDSGDEDEEKIRDVDEVSEELLEKLETTEFHELEAQEKLEILVALTHKVMMSYAVEDHIQEKQQKAAELWKEKMQVLKERKVKRNEEKQKKKDKGDGEEKKEGEKEKKGPKKKEEEKKEEEPEIPMEDDGDLASIVRRRRVLAAQAQKEKAEREKRDREEREKEMEKMKKEREEQSFKTRFEEGIAQARRTLRWQHVGTDRHHNKYWLFSLQTPGLFVEKGWAHDSMGYQVTLANSPVKKKNQQEEEEEEEESDVESVSEVQSVTSEASTVRKGRVAKHRGVEKTHPPLGQNLWFLYSKKDEVDKLIQNLGTQGIRESELKEELEKRYQDIKSSLNNFSKRNQQLRSSDGDQELLDAYKRDLEEIESKLEKGGLGNVENPAKWLKRLEKTDKISELGSLLVEVQGGVLQKFLKGMMGPQKKKPKEPKAEEDDKEEIKEEEKEEQDEEENEEEDEEEEKDENEVQLYEPREVELWRQATAECSTMSRLHVLMGVLDACIKWDKSAENAKCKVCRKKGEEERLLLCDECNQAYHIFCLRPALSCVPPGEWRCPACIPRQARVGSRGRNYREMDEGDYDSSEDEDKPCTRRGRRREQEEQEIVHREECVVCYEEGELVPCSTCPLVFHKECHIPALRNFPRGNNWVCCACQSPAKYRQLRKAKPSQPPPKQQPTRQTSRQTSTSRQAAASSTSPGTSSQSTNQSRAATQAANQGRSTAASRRAQQPVPSNKEERGELHSRRTNNELKTCEDILQKLMRNKSSVYFRKPVDVEDVPDYYKVIKKPMDLTTVKNKCVCLDYCSPQEFINDVSCIFDNAHEYNKIGSDIRDKADTLEKYFMELVEESLPSYDYPHKEAAAIHGMHNDHSYTSPQKSATNGKR
ncbi:BAZ1B [Branchiostoma lanceolatum]|uniref:Tyrosine-protein kinase BAZ1B n=1 Tax=Branchiostoma lanceolatum TaxID=7740 RepID=A0A8J9VVF1_BRALA|nr:BAZ1B [Branchiostoma lanceolatum]